MSDENKKLKLCLPEDGSLSEFVIELINEEVEEIYKTFDVDEGEFEIRTSYVHEVEDKIEVGVYLINNLNQVINFERLDLSLIKDGVAIGSQAFETKELGDTQPKSIKYTILYFKKDNVNTEDLNNVQVAIATNLEIDARSTINADLTNLPSSIKKNDLKIINQYLKELPYLAANTIDINTFSVVYDEQKNLSLILIIRNGYSAEAKLQGIPIKIYDANNSLVYSGAFTPNNSNIKPSTAVIESIFVKEEYLLMKDAVLSSFRVEFK